MSNIKNETLDLIKELIAQYSVFVERCNEYIFATAWYDNGDESSEEEAEELWQKEAKFQQEVISARDNTIYLLAAHKRALQDYEDMVSEGATFQEDKYLQEEFVGQYKVHVKRLKEHLKKVDFNKDYKENPTARFLEGKFQIKMISSIDDMLKNLEKSIGIEHNNKTISKRGGDTINPFTEEVLLKDGIQPVNQPRNLAYRDWLVNQKHPDKKNRKEYIDFWKKHLSYAITGCTVGGVEISGILYWQLNFMKIAPLFTDEHGNAKSVVINNMFRDNEYYINYNYKECEKQQKFFFGVGCRRFSKSSFMTAVFTREAYLFKHSTSLFSSLSSKEIEDLETDFNIFVENRQDCFEDIEKIGSFGKVGTKVEFAIQLSANAKKIHYSTIRYINLISATSKSDNASGQKMAGGQLSKFALEEAGKASYNTVLTVIKPSLSTVDGKLSCSPIIMATGGEISRSKDLEGDFLYAGQRGYFVGMHEEYAKHVNGFHYKQESDKKVGFFVPDVFSLYAGEKKKILFKDYINKAWTKEELDEVEGMYIHVTDWEKAKANVRKKIEEEFQKSEADGLMMTRYLPAQPEDSFGGTTNNPFDAALCTQLYNQKVGNDLWGRSVILRRNNGEIEIMETSKKPYKEFPYKGGFYDASVQIYEPPLIDKPPMWCYVAGFDGYRILEDNKSDSMGSLYILKMVGYSFQMVASYVARPSNINEFNEQCLALLEYYNAVCLAERADMNMLKIHMERNRKLHLLAKEINVGGQLESVYKNSWSKPYGQSASKKNDYTYMENNTIEFSKSNYDVKDEQGEIIASRTGLDLIEDPMLLLELSKFSKGGNFDRYSAFKHALLLGQEVIRLGVVPQLEKRKPIEFHHLSEDAKSNIIKRPEYSFQKKLNGGTGFNLM